MVFQHNKWRGGGAFTLVEMMISMGVAGLIVAGLATLTFYLTRSSSVVVNYTAVNAKDRVSLEVIGRDIREAQNFTTLTPSNLVLTVKGQSVQYSFNEKEKRLYRIVGTTNQVLLPNCTSLLFEFRQRNPSANTFESHLVSTSATCRIIQMTWSSPITSEPKLQKQTTVLNTAKYLNRRSL